MTEKTLTSDHRDLAVVGGGLAGMAAAVAAVDAGFRVELIEQSRFLGGRAGGFLDPLSGTLADRCPHVALGCCSSFLDFCRRTGIAGHWQRSRRVHFIDPAGKQVDFAPAGWLPAPLHLLPALLRLTFLSWRDRLAVARAVRRLADEPNATPALRDGDVTAALRDGDNAAAALRDGSPQQHQQHPDSIAVWLQQHGQSPTAIERFWEPVLVSALSERLDRTSVAAARKVIVDGFLATREASDLYVATEPLAEQLDRRVGPWLERRGVRVHRQCRVERIEGDAERGSALLLRDGSRRTFGHVVLAVPWNKAHRLLPDAMRAAMPELEAAVAELRPAPITAVHLGFDRPITPLPHAALLGRLSQWVFNRGPQRVSTPTGERSAHAYQVVISASHALGGRAREDILGEVLSDLQSAWPGAREAELFHSRVFTQPAAVFSPTPGHERLRPPQKTPIKNLTLAGDWTATRWPATMEGAVRSGYLAFEVFSSPPSTNR